MTVLNYRSAPAPAAGRFPDESTVGAWLGWAVYLGTSWTWCIGMFLPVLLVRDYGLNGFYVFAVPNVLGAAAMGWVLRDAALSMDIVTAHRQACLSFSLVTVTFHAFFGSWIIAELTGPFYAPFGVLALVVFFLAARAGHGWAIAVAAFVFVASAWLFFLGWANHYLPYTPLGRPLQPARDLFFIAPISAFAFALCPYLDLTFHRARQRLSRDGARVAFSVGFGVFFTAMILFTLAYAQHLIHVHAIADLMAGVVGCHLLLQAAQTTALHAREVEPRAATGAIAFSLLLVVATGCAGLFVGNQPRVGEAIYRFFMGFYSLIFPAYVWLCMIGSAARPPSKRTVIVFIAAVGLAAPMFWLGFIEGRMTWLAPGLAVVLLARLALREPLTWNA
jgi:hypothetical protein